MRRLVYGFIAAFVLSVSFSACSNDDIEGWQSKGFVWFTDTLVNFSNILQPDVPMGGQLTVSLPLTIASDISDVDRTVNVEVLSQPRDSRTQFAIQNPVVIKAGEATGTMYVNVTNSSHLDQVYDSITFRILPSADFDPGLQGNTTATLCLHNGYLKPEWWGTYCEYVFGYFSQLKMQIYVTVTGGMDDPRSSSSASWFSDLSVKYWTFVLNDYVEQNDIRYPDDDPNAPGEQPVFDFWCW